MKTVVLASIFLLATSTGLSHAENTKSGKLRYRWVYLSTNMLVEKNVEDAVALLGRAAKAGYNGVVLTDSKFMRWDGLPERYVRNVRRVRQACRDLKLDCIAAVCPVGYSNGLLSRDPNLAAGLPVREAPFLADNGRLVPADESAAAVNGGFEQHNNNRPAGWRFAWSAGVSVRWRLRRAMDSGPTSACPVPRFST